MGVSKYGIKVSTSDQYVSDSQQTLGRVEKCFLLFLWQIIPVTKMSLLAWSKCFLFFFKKSSHSSTTLFYISLGLCISLAGFLMWIHSFWQRASAKKQEGFYALGPSFSVAVLPSSPVGKRTLLVPKTIGSWAWVSNSIPVSMEEKKNASLKKASCLLLQSCSLVLPIHECELTPARKPCNFTLLIKPIFCLHYFLHVLYVPLVHFR